MIKVDRRSFPSPLDPQLVAAASARLRDFYGLPAAERRKLTFDQKERAAVERQARDGLVRLFHNKCCYCESTLGTTSSGDVDRFRPATDASNLSGEGSPDHYAWLSVDWENLYLVCQICARSKRSLFPVEGHRADIMMSLGAVRQSEIVLLIDPCFDDPWEHLKFREAGIVEALTLKGEVSIKVLNLNRQELVRQRSGVWRTVHAALRFGDRTASDRLFTDDQPYLATARAARAAFNSPSSRPVQIRETKAVPREVRSAERILADDAEAFRLTARPLRQVEITNVRALRNLSVDFGEPGAERAPWLMLLGENATGKSTLLQAIALALAGADEARRLTRPVHLLSAGAFQGSIVVHLWDQDAPVELRFRRDRDAFEGTRGPSAIVLAYGALRYAERRSRSHDNSPPFSRVGPILTPIARIASPTRWLLDLDDKKFDTASRALQAVLPLNASSAMQRVGNRIVFDVGGHQASLAELSAGYQTIVGMCADIMQHLFVRWDTLASATGIVLIDEIDAHLHPRWAMRIVGALREAFPQVQFVASTHDPLALRGLRNGEVALLRRTASHEIVADQNLPPIEGMHVEQLLTSRAFGLESTVDPETEALLDEYYHLRSLPPTAPRLARVEEIRGRVADREALGRSETERLMREASVQLIQDASVEAAGPLRQETLQRLGEIAARGAARRRRQQL